jgi:hypothetical protein
MFIKLFMRFFDLTTTWPSDGNEVIRDEIINHSPPHPNNQRAFRDPPLPRENHLDVTE